MEMSFISKSKKIQRYDPFRSCMNMRLTSERQGEIYVQFNDVESAKKSIEGLNGRWFGGKQISATFISDAIMQAHR